MNGALTPTAFPALGPRLTFFTGGTALRALSRELTRHTHNSVHLITTFDSGGSSAVLRRAFAMPAVGDIRNRLLALADCAVVPAAVLDFCACRLPAEDEELSEDVASILGAATSCSGKKASADFLRRHLVSMGRAGHRVWKSMPGVFADALRLHLNFFLSRMPVDFDPYRACFGNLLLAGGYLHHKRNFDPVLAFFSRLLQTRGVVRPIVRESLHLAAELDDGSVLVGQHLFRTLARPVRRIFLTVHEPERLNERDCLELPATPCRPPLAPAAGVYLSSAGAICYPMGSFYTSVLANLLPQGVGSTVAEADCPKIFIPNSGSDAELLGLSVAGQAAMILRHLRQDAPEAPTDRLLHHVLIDSRHGRYEGGLGDEVRKSISDMGLTIVDRHIVCENNPQYHEPELTARALLDLMPGKAAEI
ncbi:2-phospho-L-lactate transferase CofD family protein [Desulfovibrio sp. MES5]|uniref:2-phospho-L-lactate transferase CofD family protein n=1 Tax=Desulfovibrio sp. MES5 TaxID=1899016 RepID=UPI0025BBE35E|nr:2-phospho-L-lactate transferase CofD family protein [Desulfovibrio sp. MES5]